MQIPAISNVQSNKQSFQGNIHIVNDLSYLPCKYVRQAYDSIAELIKDKPFDIFIRQNHRENSLSFIAKKSKHLGNLNKPFSENIISNASTMDKGEYTKYLYTAVAKVTIENYENSFIASSKKEKFKDYLNILSNKFIKLFQDKDEI